MREHRPLVLLVDDCEDNRDLYAGFLIRQGFDVAQAGDAASGLASAFELEPDVVIMDLSLPDMDGLQAIDRLRRDRRTHDLAIVVLSGDASASELRGPAAQWDEFLVKPCMPDELVATLARILDGPRPPCCA